MENPHPRVKYHLLLYMVKVHLEGYYHKFNKLLLIMIEMKKSTVHLLAF